MPSGHRAPRIRFGCYLPLQAILLYMVLVLAHTSFIFIFQVCVYFLSLILFLPFERRNARKSYNCHKLKRKRQCISCFWKMFHMYSKFIMYFLNSSGSTCFRICSSSIKKLLCKIILTILQTRLTCFDTFLGFNIITQ